MHTIPEVRLPSVPSVVSDSEVIHGGGPSQLHNLCELPKQPSKDSIHQSLLVTDTASTIESLLHEMTQVTKHIV